MVFWLSVLCVLAHSEFTFEDSVLVLDENNFDSALQAYPTLFVEFYAPWCGHCKKFAPQYAAAAQRLQSYDPPIVIAKVDTQANKELARQHGVKSLPTLKYFVNGLPSEYTAGRSTEQLVQWLLTHAGGAVLVPTSVQELKNLLPWYKTSVVVFGDKNSPQTELLTDLSKVFTVPNYLACPDPEALTEYGASSNSIWVFTGYGQRVAEYAGELTTEALHKYLKIYRYPLIGDVEDAAEKLHKDKGTVLLLFAQTLPSESSAFTAVAEEQRETLGVAACNVSEADCLQMANIFAVAEFEAPTAVLVDTGAGKNYLLPGPHTEAGVREFVQQWRDGALVAQGKSKPIPSNPVVKGVTTLVGRNYYQVVQDPQLTVIVQVYNDWCPPCKKFYPEYEALAQELENELIFAKLNILENDVKGLKLKAFPMFVLYTKTNKEGVVYSGELTKDNLKDFIHQYVQGPRTDL